jgi:hypothetical protein
MVPIRSPNVNPHVLALRPNRRNLAAGPFQLDLQGLDCVRQGARQWRPYYYDHLKTMGCFSKTSAMGAAVKLV